VEANKVKGQGLCADPGTVADVSRVNFVTCNHDTYETNLSEVQSVHSFTRSMYRGGAALHTPVWIEMENIKILFVICCND
jgi:hypothetical protein